jgi:hypothetical protein
MLQNGGPIGNGAITDKNDMGVQAAARLESHVIQITERVGVSCDNDLISIFGRGGFLSLQPRQQRASDHGTTRQRSVPPLLHYS